MAYFTQPSFDPKTQACDWCGEPSVKAVEARKKGTYLYVCDQHIDTAERATTNRRNQ